MNRSLTSLALLLSLPFAAAGADRPLLLADISPEHLYSQQQIASQLQSAKDTNKNQLTSLQQEYLLMQRVKAFNEQSLTEQDLAFLTQAAKHQSMAYRLHDEGPLPVAIFDVATMAKAKIAAYQIQQEYLQLAELKQQNPKAFTERLLAQGSGSEEKAKLRFLQNITASEAQNIANQLLKQRDIHDPLLLAATEKAANKALYQQVLTKLTDAKAHQLLDSALKSLPAFEQETLLQAVIEHNHYLASQALNLYAKLPSQLRQGDFLIEKLADEQIGAAAAYAIGQTKDADLQQRLAALAISKTASRSQVAYALLGLRVAKTNYAKSQLQQLVEAEQIPYVDMREEVARWVK